MIRHFFLDGSRGPKFGRERSVRKKIFGRISGGRGSMDGSEGSDFRVGVSALASVGGGRSVRKIFWTDLGGQIF